MDDNERPARVDPERFIRTKTRLVPVPSLPSIRLHMAHEATGLWQLAEAADDGSDPPPPYWAFPWAGGLALAHYISEHPETVVDKRVLDLGTGSGLVAIAAAKAGARSVVAADIDRFALVALQLNAAANGVAVEGVATDLTDGRPPDCDLVAVGDLFYEVNLGDRLNGFLDRCVAAGIAVLVGDPGRTHLPFSRLTALASYRVPDVGEVERTPPRPSTVYAFGLGQSPR